VFITTVRLEDRSAILAEFDRYKPTHVLNCAGVTGRPNVDWCEDHKETVIRANVMGTINLADCCFLHSIHLTNFATGCIYQYDEAHPWDGPGFTEDDPPNFDGSFYSRTKGMTESILRFYSNVLTLRLRMPVSDDLHHRSFVTKITRYERVVNIPNSNSILHDLLPAAVAMAENGLFGVYNFTNPGSISHNEVLEMYKKYIDPQKEWENFTLEEQAQILKAPRSNCKLDTSKLAEAVRPFGIHIPEIHEAYEQCFQRMAANLKKASEASVSDALQHDNYQPKNILVTGGNGFIGSYMVRKLVANYPQYNIVNLDKMDYCASENNTITIKDAPNYQFVRGDITSAYLICYILEERKIDTVIHFAAQSHVDHSFGNALSFTENNVLGTHVMLESARACGIKKFIHISTDEVYGEVMTDAKDLHEGCVLSPTNPYAASKAAAEMLVSAYHHSFGLPIIITRSNNVYGPYQYPEKVIPKFILLLQQGMKCCIHGDGSHTRRYVHGSDVADAVDLILHKGVVGETYNIGTDFEISNRDLAQQLIRLMDKEGDESDYIELVQDRAFNDRRYAIDSTKLRQMGWNPQISFEQGLRETADWYTKHGRDWWGNISHVLVPHPVK